MNGRPFWTLNKLAVLVLLGGFALLMLEIRYIHRDVLGHHKVAWTPIVYGGLMVVAGAAALAAWDRGGRRALFWAFALGLAVGPLGVWLHNDGHPLQGVKTELSVWRHPLGGGPEEENLDDTGGGPPALAPLAFAGLGLLGMLVCARRYQPAAPGAGVRGTAAGREG